MNTLIYGHQIQILDIWFRSGHRIQNEIFGPGPILDPGLFWSQAKLDLGLLGPGTPGTRGPLTQGRTRGPGPGDPDPTRACGPEPVCQAGADHKLAAASSAIMAHVIPKNRKLAAVSLLLTDDKDCKLAGASLRCTMLSHHDES